MLVFAAEHRIAGEQHDRTLLGAETKEQMAGFEVLE
jgi:hypothetical protein